MRHNIRFLLIVTMLLLVTGSGTAQKFVHPGIDMNSADLEYMRNQVLAGKQPWKDAYDLLKEKTQQAAPTPAPAPESAPVTQSPIY